jgi:hypothetical protein
MRRYFVSHTPEQEAAAQLESNLTELLPKLIQLQKLASIPNFLDGEQFITVELNLATGQSGVIKWEFDWRLSIGQFYFDSLDEAITFTTELRKQANVPRTIEERRALGDEWTSSESRVATEFDHARSPNKPAP